MREIAGVAGLVLLLVTACRFDTSGLQPRRPDAGGDLSLDLVLEGPPDAPRAERGDALLPPDGVGPREAATDLPRADLPITCVSNPTLCKGQTPVCDGNCRACAAHSECPAGLCRADGSCPAASEISFVDVGCGSNQDGTSKKPFCTIAAAVGESPPYVLVRAGTYKDTTIDTSKEIYGEPGAILKPTACDKLVIDGKITVMLSGFEIQGNVIVKGGAKGTLLRNQIGPSTCIGVNATGAEVKLDRNLIFAHLGGGVLLDGKYRVQNNIIVKNGKSDLTWGAVKIAATDPTSLFINNTVASNIAKGSNDKEAGGVRCEAGASTAVFVNTIFWGNTFNSNAKAADDRQYGPGCAAQYSLEELKSGATAASTNISAPPQLAETGADTAAPYYRLKNSSPARDKGTKTGAPAVDYDGEPRDASPDIGADEIFP